MSPLAALVMALYYVLSTACPIALGVAIYLHMPDK